MPPGRLDKNTLGGPIFKRFVQQESDLEQNPESSMSIRGRNLFNTVLEGQVSAQDVQNNLISWKKKCKHTKLVFIKPEKTNR